MKTLCRLGGVLLLMAAEGCGTMVSQVIVKPDPYASEAKNYAAFDGSTLFLALRRYRYDKGNRYSGQGDYGYHTDTTTLEQWVLAIDPASGTTRKLKSWKEASAQPLPTLELTKILEREPVSSADGQYRLVVNENTDGFHIEGSSIEMKSPASQRYAVVGCAAAGSTFVCFVNPEVEHGWDERVHTLYVMT